MDRKLDFIDALRGIAILGVMIVNTSLYGLNDYPPFFTSLINAGEKGVQLFFVVSAFTLFLSFNRRLKRDTNINQSFFIRRFFRIAPLYYLGIIYYIWQNADTQHFWLGSSEVNNTLSIVSNFFFIHGLYPTWINSIVPGGWSITVEMLFYLFIPFIFAQIKSLRAAINFTIGTLIISQGLKSIGYAYPLIEEIELWKAYLNLYLPAQLPVFGCGIIAYFILIKKDLQVSKFNYWIICLLAFGAITWTKLIPPNVIYGIAFLGLLITLSKFPNYLLVNRLTRMMGTISYSAYLIHFAVLYWLQFYDCVDLVHPKNTLYAILNYIARFGLVILLTVPLSIISYNLIEKPTQKIGKLLLANNSKRTIKGQPIIFEK